jgi:hypothetical protein
MAAVSAHEKRIVELVLKATGDAELKRMANDLRGVKESAQASQKSLDDMEKAGRRLGTSLRSGLAAAVIAGAFHQITEQVTKAADSIADMTDKAGGGSKAFAQYSKAAQEFNASLAEIEKTFDDVVRGITAGMLPALIALAKTFNANIQSGADFVALGRQIGGVLVDITANVVTAIRYFTEFFKILDLGLKAQSAAKAGFAASLKFEGESAEKFFQAAGDYGTAAQTRFKNIGNIARQTGTELRQAYRDAQTITGKGVAEPGKGKKGGGAKGGGGADHEAERAAREAAKAAAEHAKAVAALNAQIGENNLLMLQSFAANAKLADEYNRAADPMIAYREELEKIAKAKESGMLTDEAAAMAQDRALQTMKDATVAIWENDKAVQEHKKHVEEIREQWGFVADAMADATYSIIAGTESIGRAMRRMVATIISEAFRLQAIKIANQLFSKLLPGFNIKSAQGNAFVNGQVQAFAQGGIVTGPTAFGYSGGIGIAGEAGSEVIAPLRRDASGNMGVGAVAPKVTVNNYAGADVAVQHTDQGLQIDILRRQIADDIRRGGNPVAAALEGTYKVGRYAGAFA